MGRKVYDLNENAHRELSEVETLRSAIDLISIEIKRLMKLRAVKVEAVVTVGGFQIAVNDEWRTRQYSSAAEVMEYNKGIAHNFCDYMRQGL